MDLSPYFAGRIIDYLLRDATPMTPLSTLYIGAHTGNPFAGNNEVGTPNNNGYVRAPLTLNVSSSRTSSNTAQIDIVMPDNLVSNTEVSWLAAYDASSGGNILFRIPLLGTPLEATFDGTTDEFTVGVAHSYGVNDRIVVTDVTNFSGISGIHSPLSDNTVYYVAGRNFNGTTYTMGSNTFKLSTSTYTVASGGNSIDVGASGGCIVRKVTPYNFNASNVLRIPATALTIML